MRTRSTIKANEEKATRGQVASPHTQPEEEPGRVYLDTANYGLPPPCVVDAVQEALEMWRQGASRIEDWISYCDRAREGFAQITGVHRDEVACASTTSQLVGMVASSLPSGSEVLIPDEEFTSNVFPWLAQEARGVKVVAAPVDDLADAVTARTSLVAFSLVQSSTGTVADIDRIREAADICGAQLLVDTTQASGWLPFDGSSVDYVACSAYKWLMGVRGCAFLAISPAALQSITPSAAGWFAGEDIFQSLYGPPLRLAKSARRLDQSPGWIAWAGTAQALEHIVGQTVETIHDHDMQLARSFCSSLNLTAPSSPIVSLSLGKGNSLSEDTCLVVGHRAGNVRLSFHLNNNADDVAVASREIQEVWSSARESGRRRVTRTREANDVPVNPHPT